VAGTICPLCGVAPQPDGRCPDCGQDLAPLSYLQARPALLYNRALDLVAAGDPERAARHLEAALAEDDTLVDAWTVLGKLRARSGRADDARRALAAALVLRPDHAGARAALAGLDARAAAEAEARRRARRRRLLAPVAVGLAAAGVATALVLTLAPARPQAAPQAAATTGATAAPEPTAPPTSESTTPPTTGADEAARLNSAVAAVLQVSPLLFPVGQTQLGPRGRATVAAVAGLLKGAGAVTVQVDGYAASSLANDQAQAVSEQRAAAVRDALVAAGVDRAKVVARGLAGTNPRENAQASRRVEISVRPA
jgi:outer membrane protein OmpA-like peptidoglycan-associated protein